MFFIGAVIVPVDEGPFDKVVVFDFFLEFWLRDIVHDFVLVAGTSLGAGSEGHGFL